ncbi:MAG: transposase, partial [Ferrimicrobium sp.]
MPRSRHSPKRSASVSSLLRLGSLWYPPFRVSLPPQHRSSSGETGGDMSKFPTAEHLCAWAGLAPASYESAGKRRSAGTRHGST